MKTQHPRLWCHFGWLSRQFNSVVFLSPPPPLYFHCLSVYWVPGCFAWEPWLGHTCCRPWFSNSIKRTDAVVKYREDFIEVVEKSTFCKFSLTTFRQKCSQCTVMGHSHYIPAVSNMERLVKYQTYHSSF